MDFSRFIKRNSREIGLEKERAIAKWLQPQGVKILAQNYRCRGGEIDLIGHHTASDTLIFFEVKYRKNSDFGHPAEWVSTAQQQRILRCAQKYLLKNPQWQECAIRFDVITQLSEQNPEWIENAFGQ